MKSDSEKSAQTADGRSNKYVLKLRGSDRNQRQKDLFSLQCEAFGPDQTTECRNPCQWEGSFYLKKEEPEPEPEQAAG